MAGALSPISEGPAAASSAAAAAASAANADTSATNASASAVASAASEASAALDATFVEDSLSAVSVAINFDSSTSMADPGSADMRFNHATPASVTQIAISANSAETGNPDLSAYIATWADSTSTVKAFLVIRKDGEPATFAIYTITGAITDNGTWLQIPVAHTTSTGTFSNTDGLHLQQSRSGDAGTTADSVTWIVKNTTYTAVAWDGIFADTSGGAFTVTLPATPSLDDRVAFVDSTTSFITNNLTVGRNGETIMGLAEDMTASTNNAAFMLVYTGTDWRIA